MKKGLIVLAAPALVLTIAAGAGAAAKTLINGSQIENDSITGAKIHDRSLHFVDLSASGEQMIRQGWRLAVGKDKVTETMLDPALASKIDAPTPSFLDALPKGKTLAGVIEERDRATADNDTLWSGITYRLPVSGTVTPHVLQVDQKTTECGGTYAAPTATAGNLCIYLGTGSGNGGGYLVTPVGGLGFRFAWNADHAGQSSIDATYALTAPST